jgi:hypothetical protein
MSDDLANSIATAFNDIICPVDIRWGRTHKGKVEFKGKIEYCSWENTKRKGGGYTFWISYMGRIGKHNEILSIMLHDYIQHIAELGKSGLKVKAVKNLVINPTKDLEIMIPGCIPQLLGKLFPTSIREMQNTSSCLAWVDYITNRKFQEDYSFVKSWDVQAKSEQILFSTNLNHRPKQNRMRKQSQLKNYMVLEVGHQKYKLYFQRAVILAGTTYRITYTKSKTRL